MYEIRDINAKTDSDWLTYSLNMVIYQDEKSDNY